MRVPEFIASRLRRFCRWQKPMHRVDGWIGFWKYRRTFSDAPPLDEHFVYVGYPYYGMDHCRDEVRWQRRFWRIHLGATDG